MCDGANRQDSAFFQTFRKHARSALRDLYRSEAQSYSERRLYADALHRWARELAAIEKLDERGAVQRITDVLREARDGRRTAEELPPPPLRPFRRLCRDPNSRITCYRNE